MRCSVIRLAVCVPALLALFGLFPPTVSAEPLGVDSLTTPAEPEKVIPEVQEAIERFKKQDFNGALELLKKAAAANADLPPAQVVMAQLFSQANQGNAVRVSLEKAVVEAPADPEAYVIIGDIAMAQGASPRRACCSIRPSSCLRTSRRVRGARPFSRRAT